MSAANEMCRWCARDWVWTLAGCPAFHFDILPSFEVIRSGLDIRFDETAL